MLVQTLQLEDGIEPFGEFVERQSEQFCSMTNIVLGEQVVKRLVLDEQLVLGSRVAEDGTLVYLGNSGLGQQVVGMGEQVKSLYKQANGHGGVEPESLVADNADVGQMFGEIVGDQGDVVVSAHQDSHLVGRYSHCLELADGIDDIA